MLKKYFFNKNRILSLENYKIWYSYKSCSYGH